MEDSSRSIKISMAKIEVSEPLVLGQDVTVEIKGSIVQEIIGDEQDGSVSRTFVVRGTEARVLE